MKKLMILITLLNFTTLTLANDVYQHHIVEDANIVKLPYSEPMSFSEYKTALRNEFDLFKTQFCHSRDNFDSDKCNELKGLDLSDHQKLNSSLTNFRSQTCKENYAGDLSKFYASCVRGATKIESSHKEKASRSIASSSELRYLGLYSDLE